MKLTAIRELKERIEEQSVNVEVLRERLKQLSRPELSEVLQRHLPLK